MTEKKIKEKHSKLIKQLAEICEELEWLIVIPMEETTTGLIIGNKEYIDFAAQKVYDNRYEIINPKGDNKIEPTNPVNEPSIIVELSEEEYEEFLESGELPDSVNVPDKPTYH